MNYKTLLSFSLFLLISNIVLFAQSLPYTQPIYAIRKDSAVVYAKALNYCGNRVDLKMNIYKPMGDNNTQRPVAIFIHGGGFSSNTDFNEYHMNVMAQEFAKRGYVAASIQYREGHHKFNYGVSFPQPTGLGVLLDWTEIARAYVSDSAEVVRALYRAQQDTKAAIRFMKQNHLADSTSTCNVFIGGHSAGAITALAAGLMDKTSEKSSLCNTIADAPNPNWTSSGFWWFGNYVITQINGPQDKDDLAYRTHNPAPFDYEAAACYKRSNLGKIDGSQNTTSGYDASVKGVAALAGALLDTNIISGPRQPALYLYHVSPDYIVSFNVGYPFEFYNGLMDPDPGSKWPIGYGSNWINSKLDRINYPAAYKLHVVPSLLGSHDILPNTWEIADSIAQFFARVIDTSSCMLSSPIYASSRTQKSQTTQLALYPNPAQDFVTVQVSQTNIQQTLVISNESGLEVFNIKLLNNQPKIYIPLKGLANGLYYVSTINNNKITASSILVIQH